MGIGKVGKHPEINRSPSTIRDHLKSHDAAVKRSGFCAVCRRAGGGSSSRLRSIRRPPVGKEDSQGVGGLFLSFRFERS